MADKKPPEHLLRQARAALDRGRAGGPNAAKWFSHSADLAREYADALEELIIKADEAEGEFDVESSPREGNGPSGADSGNSGDGGPGAAA